MNLETVSLGFLTETEKKVLAYVAADVFTFPTRADSLPLALREGMVCGTPIVSFAVGGVPDLVRDDETGFVASSGNIEEFAGLTTLPSDAPRRVRKSPPPLWLEPVRAN